MTKSCNQVTTSTGVFTFHDELVYKGEAKLKCQQKGEVLAPVTNLEDSMALRDAFDPVNCPLHQSTESYHIGLDLYSYGDKLVKVFNNGVLWDDAVHDPLVIDNTKDWYKDYKNYSKCPEAFLDIAWNDGKALVFIFGNKICNHKRRYVCLKPAASKCGQASALVEDGNSGSPIGYGGLIGGCIAVVVVGLVVFAVKYLKSKKKGENVLPVSEHAV